MDKAPDAFRTISEVADDLDVPQHVLRFWETPLQADQADEARRRPALLPAGRCRSAARHPHLLYGEGYTIRGVQRILRDQGFKFVQNVWQPGAEQPAHGTVDDDEEEAADVAETDMEEAPRAASHPAQPGRPHALQPSGRPTMSREDIRKLQAALFELGECRRLLDSVIPQATPE